jgi:hypothetical protein
MNPHASPAKASVPPRPSKSGAGRRVPTPASMTPVVRSMAVASNEIESRAARDPNAVVMRAVYDNEFEPWSKDRLDTCVQALASLTREFSSAADARAAAARDAAARAADGHTDAAEFAQLHPLLYQQLTDPDFVRREGMVALIMGMIDLQREVQSGRLPEAEARALVSDRALKAVTASAPPE